MTSPSDLLPSYLTTCGKHRDTFFFEVISRAPGLGNLKEVQEVNKKTLQQPEAAESLVCKRIPIYLTPSIGTACCQKIEEVKNKDRWQVPHVDCVAGIQMVPKLQPLLCSAQG